MDRGLQNWWFMNIFAICGLFKWEFTLTQGWFSCLGCLSQTDSVSRPLDFEGFGKKKKINYWISCEAVNSELWSIQVWQRRETCKELVLREDVIHSHLLQTYKYQNICKITIWRPLKKKQEPLTPGLCLSMDWNQSFQILHTSIPDSLQPPPVPSPGKLNFLLPHPEFITTCFL